MAKSHILVTRAGGFIRHHSVDRLMVAGIKVRGTTSRAEIARDGSRANLPGIEAASLHGARFELYPHKRENRADTRVVCVPDILGRFGTCAAADKHIRSIYDHSKPQGVHRRLGDNSEQRQILRLGNQSQSGGGQSPGIYRARRTIIGCQSIVRYPHHP